MTVGFVFYSEYWQTVMMKIEIPKCTVSRYSGWCKVHTKLFSCTKTHNSYTRKLKGEITKPNPKHNWLCKDRVLFLSIHPQETEFTIYFPLIISANLRDTICLHKCTATTVILHSLWDIVYELWQDKEQKDTKSSMVFINGCQWQTTVSFNSFPGVIPASSVGDF